MVSENLLLLAINAALNAGDKIIEVYGSDDFDIKIKSDDSPITIADQKAHDEIARILESTHLPILSEEGRLLPYDERRKWEMFWLVDPLDGTKEFIKRNGEFTVNIALIKEKSPVIGVVYVPVLKQLYFSSSESGAYKLENASALDLNLICLDDLIKISSKLPLKLSDKSKLRVVGSRSHMSEETLAYIDVLKQKYDNVEMVSKGSSLKLCMLAEGEADIYPRFGPTMEWDIAAGHAIAVYSGCSVTQADEKTALQYNKEELLNPYFIVKSKGFKLIAQ